MFNHVHVATTVALRSRSIYLSIIHVDVIVRWRIMSDRQKILDQKLYDDKALIMRADYSATAVSLLLMDVTT